MKSFPEQNSIFNLKNGGTLYFKVMVKFSNNLIKKRAAMLLVSYKEAKILIFQLFGLEIILIYRFLTLL